MEIKFTNKDDSEYKTNKEYGDTNMKKAEEIFDPSKLKSPEQIAKELEEKMKGEQRPKKKGESLTERLARAKKAQGAGVGD